MIASPFPRVNRNGFPFVFLSNTFPFLASLPIYLIPNFVPFLAFRPFPTLYSSIVTPFVNVTIFFSGLTSADLAFSEMAGLAGVVVSVVFVGPCSSFAANWTFFSAPLTGAASFDSSFCFLSFFL